MDRPAGGSSELVTNHTLDLKFEALEHRFQALDHRFDALESRLLAEMDRRFTEQTWKLLSAVIAAMALMAAIFGGFSLRSAADRRAC